MEIIESAGRALSLKLYPGICLTTEGKAQQRREKHKTEGKALTVVSIRNKTFTFNC